MTYQAGNRLSSATSAVQVIVVRAPDTDIELTCGGAAMVPASNAPSQAPTVGAAGLGVLVGKRYFDAVSKLEVLCTKAGAGSLEIDGRPLELMQAKPLPSSD
ncbi:hypothetical protein [Nocardia vaccinii]|uniref:hypothetical protein n=1 Tax=Nocardia vaccinii TaxID=1822 RepID=UPI000830D288|nr:hypothetical protein [Nocardia vaccinii]